MNIFDKKNLTSMNILETTLTQRKEILQKAVIQLKTEFIGIDNIIDEVADSILPWWLFPQHQLRPLIVNLWGMTGSGKTALIDRFCHLLHYENLMMRFDMGEFGAASSFLKYTLTRQLNQFNEASPVIILDEFQFAKTKDETGKEVNNFNLRIIWDLLDSGKLSYEPDGLNYYGQRAKKIIQILKMLEQQGAKIKNGIVTEKIAEVNGVLSKYDFGFVVEDRNANPNPFKPEEILISDVFCSGIQNISTDKYIDYKEVVEDVKEFNSISDLSDFIYNIMEKESAFKKMDFSKSLIFVVGNLDEAFVMSNNINPDIDADEFKRFTEKITIADIKSALQTRFRNEQIARLGNTHVIYQAFSHQDFEDLIQMHLNKLIVLTKDKFKLDIHFSESINTLLYAEGVFPTQGVRPVISTIRNLIESHIAKVILHLYEKAKKADALDWKFENDEYQIDFIEKGKKISELKLPVLQKINSLRKSTQNDLQAMIAVHEAGHTVIAMYMARVVPEYVITKTVDSESQGFTYTILPEEISTYRLYLDRIRILLGGYVAEAFVFGKENNTSGVSDDLSKVSTIAQQVFREFGMHGTPLKYNIHAYGGVPYQFTFDAEMEIHAKNIVLSCLKEVEECIKENQSFLFALSEYLSNHSRIDKPLLMEMSDKIQTKSKRSNIEFLDKETYYNFRAVLQEKLKK